MRAVVALCLALVLAGCGDDREDRPPAPPPAWERVEPGGATQTARGEPYAFWVRDGDPRRLLVFLQEGGGCFDYETCQEGSSWFDDVIEGGDDPSGQGGILDRLEPRNPFRDYTAVYIPSTTGDLHWGDARATYRAGAEQVTIEHRGFVNAMAALRWAFRNVRNPRSVFVAGCSAGSVGSAALAPYLIRHYPRARVAQLGDSLAFVFDRPVDLSIPRSYDNMPRWIPAVRALRPGRHTMADYYRAIARYYPSATFAQFHYAGDQVQRDFYEAAGGRRQGFGRDLRASLREIHAGAPNFESLVAPGIGHCILPFADFYTLRAGGRSVLEWTTALSAGDG